MNSQIDVKRYLCSLVNSVSVIHFVEILLNGTEWLQATIVGRSGGDLNLFKPARAQVALVAALHPVTAPRQRAQRPSYHRSRGVACRAATVAHGRGASKGAVDASRGNG